MEKPANNKMRVLKTVFIVLLILDIIALIFSAIALLPTFGMLAGYGEIMLIVTVIMMAIALAVPIFEIIAKAFIIRSASPKFSWSSHRKGYTVIAALLFAFNLCAVISGILSAGGEGATLLNQSNIYLRILVSVAEMVAAISYMRTIKKLFIIAKDDTSAAGEQ